MKHFSVCFFLLSTIVASAQETIELKATLKPKTTYTTKMILTNNSEINFSGDEALMEKMTSSGVSLPLKVSGTSESQVTTTTGKRRRDNTIPARMVYDRMTTTRNFNGQVKSENNEQLVGSIIEGHYDENGRFTVDTVISETMNDVTRQTLAATLKSFQQQINFPQHALAVGDSFNQEVPLEIPMGGVAPMKMIIRSKFTLKSFTRDKAFLDVEQSVELDMDLGADGNQASATGSGKGISEFDRKAGTITHYETDFNVSMEMKVEQMTIHADMESNVIQTVDVK